MANGKRPGVMIYFDLRPCLKRLSYDQKGHLLDAILTYGEEGCIPKFDDPALSIAWDFVQLRIDADGERYKRRCEKAQEAANTRWGNVPEDANSPNECERIPSDADECERMRSMPTTTTTSTSTNFLVSPRGSTRKAQPIFDYETIPYRAARWLANQIEERLPNCTPYTEAALQSWAADFDKCNRLDNHSWEDIEAVLQFSQSDPFWQTNILSGKKFRAQYTQLLAKMGATYDAEHVEP